MARILIAIMAVVASFMMVESLICKTCNYGVGSFCLSNSEVTCQSNETNCIKSTLSFDSISSVTLKSLGCSMADGCNTTTSGTLLGLAYSGKTTCCNTDRCASGAPSTKMTLTAVVGVAVLASMWSSIM